MVEVAKVVVVVVEEVNLVNEVCYVVVCLVVCMLCVCVYCMCFCLCHCKQVTHTHATVISLDRRLFLSAKIGDVQRALGIESGSSGDGPVVQRKRKRVDDDKSAADAERARREEFMRRATLDTLLLTKGEQRGKARREEEQRLRRMQVSGWRGMLLAHHTTLTTRNVC